MKITAFLSVNNGNLGAIARMSNGTWICIVYKGVKVAPKQGFQKYVWVTKVLRSTLKIVLSNQTKYSKEHNGQNPFSFLTLNAKHSP